MRRRATGAAQPENADECVRNTHPPFLGKQNQRDGAAVASLPFRNLSDAGQDETGAEPCGGRGAAQASRTAAVLGLRGKRPPERRMR